MDASQQKDFGLREVAAFFLRLGLTAFGGPAAHVALMEDEAVRRRGWLSREAFLDRLGAINLLPGPNSTQMAMALGFERAGWRGLLLGGLCFILPAALMAAGCAWAYLRWGALPRAQGLLYGVRPVILAILAQALVSLGRTAVKDRTLALLGLAAALAYAAGLHELAVLGGAGLVMLALRGRPRPMALVAAPVGLAPLFLAFLKLGAVVFGSGYVLIAFLRADLVARWHWLTEAQLLDAVAVGQITPGPVFTTATFVGFLLRGPWGALLATLGIFLPSFLLVAAVGPLVPKLRKSPSASAVLDGVNVAALALMAVVGLQLAHAALVDRTTVALALASAVLLLRFRVNPTWIVLGAGAIGLALR
ncbi:MAG TPA: chromate transporter [Holophagaceae bacterium]|nr:chromate transporter [Holophagaceae bacterium]